MEAVLSHVHNCVDRVVAYYSKTFTLEQSNYCVTQKELLAVVKTHKHFIPQPYEHKVKVQTDYTL